MPAVQVRITGRVQGVGYRQWARGQAQALELAGWVRNRPDGTVEALLAGSAAALGEMLERLRAGPPGARVDAVATSDADPHGAPIGFEIRR